VCLQVETQFFDRHPVYPRRTAVDLDPFEGLEQVFPLEYLLPQPHAYSVGCLLVHPRRRLGPGLVLDGFTFRSQTRFVTLSHDFLPSRFVGRNAQVFILLDVRPFPLDGVVYAPPMGGTTASADSCCFSPFSRLGLSCSVTKQQVSPDKNVDFPRALAQFTALPFGDLDFVVSCPLVRTHGLRLGSCSSSRGFASGFLQTLPRGNALAFR